MDSSHKPKVELQQDASEESTGSGAFERHVSRSDERSVLETSDAPRGSSQGSSPSPSSMDWSKLEEIELTAEEEAQVEEMRTVFDAVLDSHGEMIQQAHRCDSLKTEEQLDKLALKNLHTNATEVSNTFKNLFDIARQDTIPLEHQRTMNKLLEDFYNDGP